MNTLEQLDAAERLFRENFAAALKHDNRPRPPRHRIFRSTTYPMRLLESFESTLPVLRRAYTTRDAEDISAAYKALMAHRDAWRAATRWTGPGTTYLYHVARGLNLGEILSSLRHGEEVARIV